MHAIELGMHAIELGSEVAQSLLVSHPRGRDIQQEQTKGEFCHEMSNGAANVF